MTMLTSEELNRFNATYQRLERDGKTDKSGGTEYRRVLCEFIETLDRPDDLEQFIIKRAKATPGS